MSVPAAKTALPTSAPHAALRIVLFGMPDAGKSSLLGALAQAAQTQEHVLHGHLTDLTHGLADLERRLYEETPRETLEEVAPYPVIFEPFAGKDQNKRNCKLDVVLVDCDGRAANDLMARRRSLGEAAAGPLAQAVLEADALVLAIDASASESQIDADFAEFGRFLRLLEHSRGQRTDVGGLPVFLVLTKCDLLAKPTATPTAWMETIEERKRQVGGRFRDFLAAQRAREQIPFGRIDLHLWATAVKRPALEGSPARPRDPYGVAELFRQSLEHARKFRKRRKRSSRLLFWTALGTLGVVAAMIGLIILSAILVFNRPVHTASDLEISIRNYRASEGQTSSERLSGDLQRKINKLKDFERAQDFDRLPQEMTDYVHQRIEELEQYRDYRDKLAHIRLADAERIQDLDQLQTRLKTELAIPQKYQEAWAQTDAALLHDRLLKDVGTLHGAVTEAVEWYRRQIVRGEDLRTFAAGKPGDVSSWDDWHKQVTDLVSEKPPHPESEEVDSTMVAYASVNRMEELADLQKEWKLEKLKLEDLRELIAALGLTGKLPGGERQPLDIPEGFSVEESQADLRRLENFYPDLEKDIRKIDLPDAVAADLRQIARNRYERLIEAGRKVVLQHLQQLSPDGQETPDRWHSLAEWLTNPEELRDWRVLATMLAGLQNPNTGDPVAALADFVKKDDFEINLNGLKLETPYDLMVQPLGPLSVHYKTGNESERVLSFDIRSSPEIQARKSIYPLIQETVSSFTYHPGDLLWAEMPAKKEGETGAWTFTWSQCRSEVYEFERLVRSPRLHRSDELATEGKIAEGVFLHVADGNGIPPLPDLMPVVKLNSSTGQGK